MDRGPAVGLSSARFEEEAEVRAQGEGPSKVEERVLTGQGGRPWLLQGKLVQVPVSALAGLSPVSGLLSSPPGSQACWRRPVLPSFRLRAPKSAAPFARPGPSSLPPSRRARLQHRGQRPGTRGGGARRAADPPQHTPAKGPRPPSTLLSREDANWKGGAAAVAFLPLSSCRKTKTAS